MLRRNDTARSTAILWVGPSVYPAGVDTSNFSDDLDADAEITATTFFDYALSLVHGARYCVKRNLYATGKCDLRNMIALRIPQNCAHGY